MPLKQLTKPTSLGLGAALDWPYCPETTVTEAGM